MKNIIKKFFIGAGTTLAGVSVFSSALGGLCLVLYGLPLRDDSKFDPVILVSGVILWCILGGVMNASGAFDDEKKEYSTHTCDYCGGKIKIGTGKHWPLRKSDNCTCACDKCLPTIQE